MASVPLLTSYSLYTQVMLILILMGAFSFEKGLHVPSHQNPPYPLMSIATKIVKNKFFWAINVHKNSQWKLWSDYFKSTFEGVNFQKSCIPVILAGN